MTSQCKWMNRRFQTTSVVKGSKKKKKKHLIFWLFGYWLVWYSPMKFNKHTEACIRFDDVKCYFDLKLLLHQMVCQKLFYNA